MMPGPLMTASEINDRWPIVLPDFRAEFHRDRPTWEAGRLASCAERMHPGMTVFDVGAEHGDFTSLYKLWVGAAGRVIPVEPAPAMWPCIRAIWQANDLGPIGGWFAGFASNETAECDAYEGDRTKMLDGWPAMATAEVQADPGFRHLAQETNHTPQTRLDDLALTVGIPDVIVMDIEGAEYNALQGTAGLLLTTRPLVYVSVHDIGDWNSLMGWYGKTADDLHRLMADEFGYTATELPHHGEGEHFWLYEAT